jgi:hypothetical protein
VADGETRGVITPIAWSYAIFGAGLGAACFAGAQIGPFRLCATDAIMPGLIIVAAAGTILRRSWGRYLCYFFSVLFLPGVPLGTIIGGLMIYQLTIYRSQFSRQVRHSNL